MSDRQLFETVGQQTESGLLVVALSCVHWRKTLKLSAETGLLCGVNGRLSKNGILLSLAIVSTIGHRFELIHIRSSAWCKCFMASQYLRFGGGNNVVLQLFFMKPTGVMLNIPVVFLWTCIVCSCFHPKDPIFHVYPKDQFFMLNVPVVFLWTCVICSCFHPKDQFSCCTNWIDLTELFEALPIICKHLRWCYDWLNSKTPLSITQKQSAGIVPGKVHSRQKFSGRRNGWTVL